MRPPDYDSGDGRVRLWLGDCLTLLDGIKADAVVTDPPYNVGFRYESHDDQMPEHVYLGWLRSIFCQSAQAGARSIVWFWQGIRVANGEARGCLPEGWWIHHLGSWFKREFAGDLWKGGHPAYTWEPIVWATNYQDLAYAGPRGGHAGRDCLVGNSSRHDKQAKGHPCPKTESVVRSVVGWVPAEVVADPFMGSGTTGVATVSIGKRFVGIEKEPKYFDIAVRRIERALQEDRSSLFPISAERERQKPLFEDAT